MIVIHPLSTFLATVNRIHQFDYYSRHKDVLDNYFDIYDDVIRRYEPVRRLENLWSIYQNPKYQ
jgi:hypothetical protein